MTSPPPGSSGPVVAVAPRAQYPLLAETRAPLGSAAVPIALQRSLALVPHQQSPSHHSQSQPQLKQATLSGSATAKGLGASPAVARVRLPQSPMIAAR
jgi:hypothetical protein